MGALNKETFTGITYGVMGMGTEGGKTPYRITVKNWGQTPILFITNRVLQHVLSDRTMKNVIFIILMLAWTLVCAQTPDNLDTLNRLWQVVQQVDGQAMENVSEEKLGVRISLPVESTRPPSTVLMQSLSGSTTWLFSKNNLEAQHTNLSAIRYERHHY